MPSSPPIPSRSKGSASSSSESGYLSYMVLFMPSSVGTSPHTSSRTQSESNSASTCLFRGEPSFNFIQLLFSGSLTPIYVAQHFQSKHAHRDHIIPLASLCYSNGGSMHILRPLCLCYVKVRGEKGCHVIHSLLWNASFPTQNSY